MLSELRPSADLAEPPQAAHASARFEHLSAAKRELLLKRLRERDKS
jgi:hypothetical protein